MNIYRYMSFFELYRLVKYKKLKFSKLSLMDDDNEGLGVALDSLLPSTFNGGFNSTHEEIKKHHERIKDSRYITCWSKEKDSMAMWLLYSKNKDYIRVQTSYKKLEGITQKFSIDNCSANHLKSPTGTMQTCQFLSSTDAVKYVDFNNVFSEIKKLHKEERENLEKLHENLEPLEILSSQMMEKALKIKEEIRNKASEIIPDWQSSLSLKDRAYKYEEEIRASVSVNMRNDLSYEEYKNRDTSNEFDILFSGTETCEYNFPLNTFSNILEIDVEDDFIEEICFDPRMPSYQVEIYKDALGLDDDDKIVTTNIFGLISEERNFGMGYFSGSHEDKES